MKWLSDPDEFFVGYLPEAPKKTASFLRGVIISIGITVVVIGIALVYSQRESSAANFEYGIYTSVEGFIFEGPVPHIKVLQNKNSTDVPVYQSILLVGFGKMGADKTLQAYKSSLGKLDGKYVKLTGQLIHGHGKALIQIEEEQLPELLESALATSPSSITSLGKFSQQGEILDPKCYFGVMKPGEGKPHMSCAIRCISGGIPPVFRASEMSDYYLLLDENLEPVNQNVPGMVGYTVSLSGTAMQFDDWKILLINKEQLKKQSLQSALTHSLMAMEEGMTLCGMN